QLAKRLAPVGGQRPGVVAQGMTVLGLAVTDQVPEAAALDLGHGVVASAQDARSAGVAPPGAAGNSEATAPEAGAGLRAVGAMRGRYPLGGRRGVVLSAWARASSMKRCWLRSPGLP